MLVDMVENNDPLSVYSAHLIEDTASDSFSQREREREGERAMLLSKFLGYIIHLPIPYPSVLLKLPPPPPPRKNTEELNCSLKQKTSPNTVVAIGLLVI